MINNMAAPVICAKCQDEIYNHIRTFYVENVGLLCEDCWQDYLSERPQSVIIAERLQQVEQENAALHAQLEQEQHRVAMLQEVIDNIGGALDANQKSWFEMEAEAAAMREAIENAVYEWGIYQISPNAMGIYDAMVNLHKALASPGSELATELRRLREIEALEVEKREIGRSFREAVERKSNAEWVEATYKVKDIERKIVALLEAKAGETHE